MLPRLPKIAPYGCIAPDYVHGKCAALFGQYAAPTWPYLPAYSQDSIDLYCHGLFLSYALPTANMVPMALKPSLQFAQGERLLDR